MSLDLLRPLVLWLNTHNIQFKLFSENDCDLSFSINLPAVPEYLGTIPELWIGIDVSGDMVSIYTNKQSPRLKFRDVHLNVLENVMCLIADYVKLYTEENGNPLLLVKQTKVFKNKAGKEIFVSEPANYSSVLDELHASGFIDVDSTEYKVIRVFVKPEEL